MWYFLDLSKASDTVNHHIILQKHEHYGIRGIVYDWLKSYLNNRKQFVSLGSVESELKNVSCGAPQDSLLGNLFLLYVNHIQNFINIIDIHIFADDSNFFYPGESLSALEITVYKQIAYVHD